MRFYGTMVPTCACGGACCGRLIVCNAAAGWLDVRQCISIDGTTQQNGKIATDAFVTAQSAGVASGGRPIDRSGPPARSCDISRRFGPAAIQSSRPTKSVRPLATRSP